MTKKNTKTCAVIGCGVSGVAAAIRMKSKGYDVTVFEANAFPGGKLSEEYNKGYRFDMGPSVFTMPEYVDQLFKISNKNPRDYYQFKQLNPVYQYFFEDETVLDSFHGKVDYAAEMAKKTKDSQEAIEDYLSKTETVYELTDEVFLQNSLHKFKNFLTKQTAKGILNFGKIGAFDTMHNANAKAFKDPRLVQIFNRYATYNGSNPYEAPATLNVIPFLEIIKGAYYPEGGMFTITKSLVKLAQDIGIEIKFNSRVNEIVVENGKATGLKANDTLHKFDVVISNMDVYNTYHKLIPSAKKPKTIHQEKSSSGIVFYWGIKHSFPQLRLHNILFSNNYEEEFDTIFHKKTVYKDPTIYINITSKETPTDAPEGCENWFTMINVPNNSGQNWDELINELRESVIEKVNRILKTDIRSYIDCEMIFEPRVIESRTSSAFGAIYGNASNNKFAAFLRHPNFSKRIKNLYFCGGSVHPGPSIPLCLLSAKITTDLIKH